MHFISEEINCMYFFVEITFNHSSENNKLSINSYDIEYLSRHLFLFLSSLGYRSSPDQPQKNTIRGLYQIGRTSGSGACSSIIAMQPITPHPPTMKSF